MYGFRRNFAYITKLKIMKENEKLTFRVKGAKNTHLFIFFCEIFDQRGGINPNTPSLHLLTKSKLLILFHMYLP